MAGDPKAGEVVFKQCATCHSLDADGNKQGPSLAGLFGRKAGSIKEFNYSDANNNSGTVWDEAIFRKYMADPAANPHQLENSVQQAMCSVSRPT